MSEQVEQAAVDAAQGALAQVMAEGAGAGSEQQTQGDESAAPVAEQPAEAPAEAPVEAAAEPEKASGPDRMTRVMRALGEIPDKPNESLIEGLDEKAIEKLPDSAKGVVKHLIAQQRQQAAQRQAEVEQRIAALEEREKQLKADARTLIRNRAQLNQVLLDPKFQELLKAADMSEEDMGDPTSEEGISNRIKKNVASAMREFQRPITTAAHRAQQMAAYNDFVESHPKMQEKSFKGEVRQLMQQRQEAGTPVSLEDAYGLVERERLISAERARLTKERKARSESARRVQRATQSSQPDTGDPVPDWVMKKGYKSARGNLARIQYLRDHPKALEKLRAQQRNRRR